MIKLQSALLTLFIATISSAGFAGSETCNFYVKNLRDHPLILKEAESINGGYMIDHAQGDEFRVNTESEAGSLITLKGRTSVSVSAVRMVFVEKGNEQYRMEVQPALGSCTPYFTYTYFPFTLKGKGFSSEVTFMPYPKEVPPTPHTGI